MNHEFVKVKRTNCRFDSFRHYNSPSDKIARASTETFYMTPSKNTETKIIYVSLRSPNTPNWLRGPKLPSQVLPSVNELSLVPMMRIVFLAQF